MKKIEKISKPWYETIYRWGQTNLTENDPVKCDMNFWRSQWKETKVQGVIVNCGGIVAYYPSKYGLQYRAEYLGEKDFYKEFSEAAEEAGLVVVARMDINRVTQEFYMEHPDWVCVDSKGNPIKAQDRYCTCVNSDYYKKFIPMLLEEIIERYHPVGFADNSWKGLGRDTICYCENCKKGFKEACGLELPKEVDYENPDYREWIRWNYRCRTENWDLFNETTKRMGGEHCLWVGMLDADPTNLSGAFGDLKEICKRARIIFSDIQSRDSINGFEKNSVNGSLLRMAAYENVLVPESFANYVRGNRTFRLAGNPERETNMWMVEGAAGGISPWYHHIGCSQNDRRQFKTPIPFFKWHAENEQYLYNRRDMANVGIVWNQTNADFYGKGDIKEKVTLPWNGFTHALAVDRIPFIPINAEDIQLYMDRIRTLILPDVAILNDKQIDAILKFLNLGGNLIMTGKSASLDYDGNPTKVNLLWKKLGLRLTGESIGVFGDYTSNWEFFAAHNYLKLPKERHEILRGFEDTDIIGFGGGLHLVETSGQLKPIASYIPAFPIYPPEFSWIREEREDVKSLFAGTLESGSRVVYFPGDIDRCYGRERLPDHGRLLTNAVRWATNDSLPIEVQGPGFIDCKIYSQEDKIIIHLVNLSGCNISPGFCEENLPIGPVTISVNTQGKSYETAQLRVANRSIPVQMKGNVTILKIDKLIDHEMIIL
ncbi:MAG TPA: alpha-amylase family protein [Clostridiaceae bacterium]